MRSLFSPFLALFFALNLLACSDSPREETLTIGGSYTIGEHLMPQLAKAFLESQGIKIQLFQQNIVKGVRNNVFYSISIRANGSKSGLSDIKNGSIDLAMISENQLIAAWQGDTLRLANDSIAVITHRHNPILTLNADQISAIFLGKITKWQALTSRREIGTSYPYKGTINVHIRDSASGTFSAFQHLVLQDSAYSLTAQRHVSNSDLFDDIRRDYYGIGYISASELSNNDDFKRIKVKNGSFNRPLFLLSPKEKTSDLTKDFLAFCRSETARSIIESLNFKF